ncbi:chloride channel [Coniochaeta sp. 2T2.1]|nr:chloride channel [Coniochaeta sp. 2T2.1]
MAESAPSQSTPLLHHHPLHHSAPQAAHNNHLYDGDVESIISSHVSKDERALLHSTPLGERLAYNDYTTIDWLHDLVKDSVRTRTVRAAGRRGSIRSRVAERWDMAQGWVAAAIVGLLTACIAFVVNVSVATAADWKEGYCRTGVWLNRRGCCTGGDVDVLRGCEDWRPWAETWTGAYGVYVGYALVFGLLAGCVTLTTKASLPAVSGDGETYTETAAGKTMYMAAGNGIPEIKTILSGFVIPHFLDLKVLLVKAVGATFAVATGMCLGKEGPFVHISTCMREMLSVACSAGLSVAFGAPIGGVLFSYEEISTYFPRRVLWRSFLCSLVAAAALKEFNPSGTGKLVLFETNYGVDYDFVHYLVFIFLGICGGVFGGVFCQANFAWSKAFRKYPLIKNNPDFELLLVVAVTALLQYPNRLIRDTGDIVMEELLVDCNGRSDVYVCQQEAMEDKSSYYAWLISGTFVKLLLTIITFGCKVPSGIIIPAVDAGALFGRMVGQLVPNISPGIFAMVGSAAFLAGVSRMTVSLAVIMFELTGEVNFIPPFMIAILTAKWVADAISAESVYDLSQHLLGHPFLDAEHAIAKLRQTLKDKLGQLKARGLMDAGLVLVNERAICHGYLAEAELEFALGVVDELDADAVEVDLLDGVFAEFIDRSPLTVTSHAPIEYAVEMFGKLGLRYLVIVEEETARVRGVVIKKRLVSYLDSLN